MRRLWRGRWLWIAAALITGAWLTRTWQRRGEGAAEQTGRRFSIDPRAFQPAMEMATRAGQAVIKGARRAIKRA
ncbi:MAG TPA: hypothetical protein VF234_06655 [Limnochordia bacterium]